MQSRCSTSLCRLRRASLEVHPSALPLSLLPLHLNKQWLPLQELTSATCAYIRQLTRKAHSRADVSQPASFPHPRIATLPRPRTALNTRRRTPSPLPPTPSTRPSTPTASSRCLASSRRSGAHIDPFSPPKFGLADEHGFATTQERQAPQQRVSQRSLRRWEGERLTQVSLCRQCIQALDYAVGHSPINERRLSKDGQTLVEDTRSEQRLSRRLPSTCTDPLRPTDIIRVLKEIVAEKNDDELFQNFL